MSRKFKKLRAVIDTNLFISGFFGKNSVSSKIKECWINQDFILVTSMEIIREVNRVFHYPRIQEKFKPKDETLKEFFILVLKKAYLTGSKYKIDKIKDDPTDNMFLACALEGNADYIVSRDPHLRNIKYYQGVQIIDATTFLSKIEKSLIF